MFGLGFLAPAFLAGLLAVAVPVVLHLFHRRTDRVVDFPAAGMVPDAPVQQQERRRLRDLLLLALRVGALVLLAFSFARPYVQGAGDGLTGRTTIVAVDVSLSTSAPATWRELRRRALAAVDEAPAADLVGVVAFDDLGRIVAPPSASRDAARSAVETLVAGAGGTSYAAALGTAVDALGGASGRIVVVTDLQQRGWAGRDQVTVPGGVDVRVDAVPPAPDNLAVTALRAGDAVTAVVQNFAPGPRATVARLTVDGREVARVDTALAPLAAAEVRFPGRPPARGVAAVSIDDADGFQGDNVRYRALDPERPLRVLVLTADPPETATTGLYVQRALEAAGEAWPVEVDVRDGRRFSAAAGPAYDAAVVVGTRTLDRGGRARLAAYLSGGGRVLLSLGPDVDVPTLGEALGFQLRVSPEPVTPRADDTAIVASDRRHPVWRLLAGTRSALGRVAIGQYRQVLDEAGWDVLARFAGGAIAFAERRVERGTLLLFASDLDNRWNRFPLEPGFAPFIVESAQYLTRGVRPATAFVLPDVPADVPPQPGVHRAAAAGGAPSPAIVVNVDPAESDPSAITAEAFAARVQTVGTPDGPALDEDARAREERQRLWQVGLAVMLGLLVVESLVGRQRRPRVAPRSG
ncbi:MAG: BatA and WFA domain-containing protein [Vicinamibacterales bacterium]